MAQEEKRLQKMIFGNPDRFAIYFAVSSTDKLTGTIFFWIGGVEIGWRDEVILPVNALCFLERSLAFPDEARKKLCTFSDEKALHEVYQRLFVNDERSDVEIRNDEHLFMPYLVSDYGTRSFDGWLVIRLSCESRERLIWGSLNDGTGLNNSDALMETSSEQLMGPSRMSKRSFKPILEGQINLDLGEYRRVVEEAIVWARDASLID